jgi:hypothetical protein
MNKRTKQNTFLLILLLIAGNLLAQDPEEEYKKVINERAKKIVDVLGLESPQKEGKVQQIIAMQYKDLRTIHDQKSNELKLVKAKKEADSKAKENELKAIEEVTDKKLDKLHKKYLAKLSKELTPDQIEQVKDGMTYKVLPITYNGYLAMIPNLTENQKVYIKTQLTEAREHAMDAGTSEEKHKWFGKYKGKINNYLSKEGYDLKKEEAEWAKRREENPEANKK